MRAVGVEKSAAVRSENLDRFLRSDRPLRDHLFLDHLRGRLAIGAGNLHRLRVHQFRW